MKKIITRQWIHLFILMNLTACSAFSAQRGAQVPFQTFEAEDAAFGDGARLNRWSSTKNASSEKAYVHLEQVGSMIQFSNMPAANRLTIRYSIPQDTQGTLSLYINDQDVQDIFLTSDHSYDIDNSSYVRRYDEISVAVNINAGDTIMLKKDSDDACQYYGIDLIDLETAPAPTAMPSNFLSIADYGATADDETDDTQAIRDCISAAESTGKNVWIPQGTFLQNTRLSIPEYVDLRGAGMWYSNVHFSIAGTTFSNDIGYALKEGSMLSDIRFTGEGVARGQACIMLRPIGHDMTLERLWVQNVGCVYGWEHGSTDVYNVEVRHCKIIGTFFDGFHWGDGAAFDNIIENVYFRGLGDDAVAQVNRKDMPLCYNNVAQFNTIVASYWGRGMANIGGDDLVYSDNIISSTYNAGLMIATEPLGPSESRSVNNFQFLRNTIRNCGHAGHNHGGIHVWLNSAEMSDVLIKDNLIEYGATKGIRIDNTDYGDAGGRTVFENNISRCNNQANYDNGSNDIEPVLINNDFSGCEETGVESDEQSNILQDYSLQQNYPNPFNPATTISYELPKNVDVTLTIFDVVGQEVEVLVDGNQSIGSHSVNFQTSDLASGVYFYQLNAGNEFIARKKMLFVQ